MLFEEVLKIKMNTIIIPVLLLLLPLCLAIYKTIDINKIIFVCFSLYIFVLFFTGILLGTLKVGFYFLLFLFIGLFVYLIYCVLKKQIRFNKTNFLDLLSLCAIVIVIAFANRNRTCVYIDEYTHWADIVKTMTIYNDFGTNVLAHSLFKSYPPSMALFQYIGEKISILLRSGYRDNVLFICYQMMVVALFLPVLSCIKNNKQKYLVFITYILSLTLVDKFIETNVYGFDIFTIFGSVYIDPFLSCLSASSFLYILLNKEKDIFYHLNVYAYIFVLTIAKDSGLMFSAFTLFLYLLDNFKVRDKIVYAVLGLVTIVSSKLLWLFEIRNVPKSFSNPIIISKLLEVIVGNDISYRFIVFKEYWNKFLNSYIDLNIFKINFAVYSVIVILIIAAVLLKKKHKTTFILVAAQYCLYVFGMLVTYLFKFEEVEALMLSSFDRYIKTELLVITIIALVLLVIEISEIDKRYLALFTTCLVVISFSNNTIKTILHGGLDLHKSWDNYEYLSKVKDYSKNLFDSKIYIVDEGGSDHDRLYLRYILNPNISEAHSVVKNINPNDTDSIQVEPEQWINYIAENYDYVLVLSAWPKDYDMFKFDFLDEFSYLFENEAVFDGWLYRVDKENNKLTIFETFE